MKRIIICMALLVMAIVPVSAYAIPENAAQRQPADVAERITAAKEAAKAKSLQAKAEAEQRKLTITQDRCDAMKDRLVTTVPKLSQGVNTVKATLDKNYTRIEAVHAKGTLNTPDYDSLVATVEEAKAKAETSISLIDPSSVTVDCASRGLGTQLDSYRSTLKEARTSLKEYRIGLVNLVSAMNASANKTSQESTNESN